MNVLGSKHVTVSMIDPKGVGEVKSVLFYESTIVGAAPRFLIQHNRAEDHRGEVLNVLDIPAQPLRGLLVGGSPAQLRPEPLAGFCEPGELVVDVDGNSNHPCPVLDAASDRLVDPVGTRSHRAASGVRRAHVGAPSWWPGAGDHRSSSSEAGSGSGAGRTCGSIGDELGGETDRNSCQAMIKASRNNESSE